ncbi:MAG TPA: nucleoside deaminase [Thermosynechococcaceae cyanobacterium]
MSIEKPTELDEQLMAQAIAEAQSAIDQGKAGVGALLAWNDEVLAIGHNAYEETKDQINHAEIVVLHSAADRMADLSDAEREKLTLYSTLEPCLMCMSALSIAGIKRVVYSALTEDANEEQQVVKGLTAPDIHADLARGEMTIIPGVQRDKGQHLLAQMGKNS